MRIFLAALISLACLGLWQTSKCAEEAPGKPAATFDTGKRVNSLAFSSVGSRLAAGDEIGQARVWNLDTKKQNFEVDLGRGQDGSAWIQQVVFSPDGKTVAVCRGDANLYDAESGESLGTPGVHSTHQTLAFAPTGKTVACLSHVSVEFHRVGKWKRLRSFSIQNDPQFAGAVEAFTLLPDGRLLAGIQRGKVHVWDVASGQPISTFGEQEPRSKKLAHACRGRVIVDWVIEADKDRDFSRFDFAAWETITGEERFRHSAKHKVTVAAFAADGSCYATASGKRVQCFDLETHKELARFEQHAKDVTALALADNGGRLASADSGGTVLVWDLPARKAETSDQALAQADLDGCWDRLQKQDAAQAWSALQQMRKHPASTVDYLAKVLPVEAKELSQASVEKLVIDLNDDDFKVRQRASSRLEALGTQAESALRTARDGKLDSLELRRRIEKLLEQVEKPTLAPKATFRLLRSVELLESIGTKEACELIDSLAKEEHDPLWVREARAANERLKARAGK